LLQSVSILTAVFPGEPWSASFIGDKDDGSGGDNWSYKMCKAPLKSLPNRHPTFYRLMPFLSPHQQSQSTEGKQNCSSVREKIPLYM